MNYAVHDTLSDEKICERGTEVLALAEAARLGGRRNCFFVFPVPGTEAPKKAEQVVKKTSPGYGPGLFD